MNPWLLVLSSLSTLLVVPIVACNENCETSSLLQKGGAVPDGLALSQTVSFTSPEFQKMLPKIDDMMKPISTVNISSLDCLRMVRGLSTPTIKMNEKALLHTGFLVPDGNDTIPGADIARKLRLLPLSFLTSQDLENSKLIFWSNLEPTHPMIQEIFEPISKKYGESFEIKQWYVEAEFAKVAAHYAPENASALTTELVHIFREQTVMSSKSHLMRYALLYNYGGAWIDSDVLLVQDLAPLLEEDWATLMYENFVNPALLSVSRPASPFITAWLRNVLAADLSTKWGAYGPSMITRMTREVQESLAEKNFHVLPPCFFEGALKKKATFSDQITTDWDRFFWAAKPRSMPGRLNYIDPSRNRMDHSTFGYHWHNRWDKPINHGSLAEAAEKRYCQLLNIKLK